MPKLFGPIRERYLDRPGGYTRILRIEPVKEDQAESAILELVDGPKDMRFAMTAKILARLPHDKALSEMTAKNVKKVTQFRDKGMEQLQEMISKMKVYREDGWDDRKLPAPKRVYLLEQSSVRNMHYADEVKDWELPNKFWQEPDVDAPAGTPMWELRKVLEEKKQKKMEAARSQAEEQPQTQEMLAEVHQTR